MEFRYPTPQNQCRATPTNSQGFPETLNSGRGGARRDGGARQLALRRSGISVLAIFPGPTLHGESESAWWLKGREGGDCVA